MDNLDTKPASINDFEQAVLSRNYEQAEQLIVKLIKLYGKDKITLTLAPFDRKLTPEQADLESYQVLEKLAYTLTIWFSDPNWQPSPQIYQYLAMQKHFINSIFAASSYHSTDHIVQNLGLFGKSNYSVEEVKRILLVFTIESDVELPWGQLLQHLPNETAQAFIGLVSSIGIQLSQRAQKNISALLDTVAILPPIETNELKNLGPIIKAYFNCSNLADPKKYELKKWIVRTIEETVERVLTPGVKKRIKNDVKKVVDDKEKPTILVIHEVYKKNHAMYRGHHPRISALKEKFYTIGMGQEGSFDEVAQADFDENIVFPESEIFEIEKLVKRVLKLKPDIILYPSVGMSFYAPFLASQRLAPIQVASAGHPSSTYFDTIDYFHCIDVGQSSEAMDKILTEKWLPNARGEIYRKEQIFSLSDSGSYHTKANIIINGVIQKVSNELISACQLISKHSKVAVTFHIFMAHPKQDIEYFAAKSMLRRFLPNSVLHPFTDYSNYMSVVNKCLFALPTVPFGGTNSNVDLIRLNTPKLFVYDENDISGMSDLDIWQAIGFLKCQCDDLTDVVRQAITWLNEPEALEEVVDEMKSLQLINNIQTGGNLSSDKELAMMLAQIVRQGDLNE